MYLPKVSSSESAPRSRRIAIAAAVNVLVREPIPNRVAGPFAMPRARSAKPNPATIESWPSRRIRIVPLKSFI